MSQSFPWVPVEVVLLVEHDQLKPEHLVKLCNPESLNSLEASRSTGLTLPNRQLSVVNDSSNSQTSTFVKAIPSIAALAQVWLVSEVARLKPGICDRTASITDPVEICSSVFGITILAELCRRDVSMTLLARICNRICAIAGFD